MPEDVIYKLRFISFLSTTTATTKELDWKN